MTLIGCWCFTGMPTENGVRNSQTMFLRPDSSRQVHEGKQKLNKPVVFTSLPVYLLVLRLSSVQKGAVYDNFFINCS